MQPRLDTKLVREFFRPSGSPPNEKGGLFPQSPVLAVPKRLKSALPACLVVLLLFLFFGGSPFSSAPGKHTHFPKKIWQTWKVDPLGFEERDSSVAKSWLQKNPDFRYEVLTDQNDMAYVDYHFGPEGLNRPDIVYMYRQLTARIIKADLLRYMIMYVEGGIYTDIDVEALRPIHTWIPERWEEKNVDMIIGIEIDQPDFSNHTILGQKCMSFVQWTFMCKPHLQVMMVLIEYIMNWLNSVAREQSVPISEIKLDFDQVITGTGPTAFTRAIMADMEKRSGRSISWDEFHNLMESKLIGGTLVLTVEAFAAGQGHSDSGSHDGKHSLIRHHYHASKWPTAHPRLKHPVYNEVEQCNWERECVDTWDRNVAEFETFDQEEKDRRIAEKEEDDRRREEEDRQREEEDNRKKEEEEAERIANEEKENYDRAVAEQERQAAEQAAYEASEDRPGEQQVYQDHPPEYYSEEHSHQEAGHSPMAQQELFEGEYSGGPGAPPGPPSGGADGDFSGSAYSQGYTPSKA